MVNFAPPDKLPKKAREDHCEQHTRVHMRDGGTARRRPAGAVRVGHAFLIFLTFFCTTTNASVEMRLVVLLLAVAVAVARAVENERAPPPLYDGHTAPAARCRQIAAEAGSLYRGKEQANTASPTSPLYRGEEQGDTASSYGHLLFRDLFESLDKVLRTLSAAALEDAHGKPTTSELTANEQPARMSAVLRADSFKMLCRFTQVSKRPSSL